LTCSPRIHTIFGMYLALSLAVVAQQPAPQPLRIEKVKENLYLISGQGGNAAAYVTKDGVILVDTKFERSHDEIIARLKSVTDKPIKFIIITHTHADHTGGIDKMQADGAVVISTSNTRQNMMKNGQAGVPQIGFVGQVQVALGGNEVTAYQFRGHTSGDAVVLFPASRAVALGDLIIWGPNLPPVMDYANDGSWYEVTSTLDEILRLDWDVAITGHGPVASRQDIINQRNMLEAVRNRVRGMLKEKKTKDEIWKVLTDEFKFVPGPAQRQIDGMLIELQ
jgi:cyclase